MYNNRGGLPPVASQMDEIRKLGDDALRVHPKCKEEMGKDAILCLIPYVAFPFIKTPIFIAQSYFDTHTIFALHNVPIEDLLNPMVISYIDRMYDATTAALQLAIGRAKTGMYLTSCLEHLIPWNGMGTVQALTLREAFGRWYFEDPSTKIIEECAFVGCGVDCVNDFDFKRPTY